jgi:hypothetical protein
MSADASFGIVMWEVLTRALPYADFKTSWEVVDAVSAGRRPEVAECLDRPCPSPCSCPCPSPCPLPVNSSLSPPSCSSHHLSSPAVVVSSQVPESVPPLYTALMCACWQPEPGARPTFSQCLASLDAILKAAPDCPQFST